MTNNIFLECPALDIDLIAERVTQAELLDMPADDLYHLFSLSPLSSAESSRSASPAPIQPPTLNTTNLNPVYEPSNLEIRATTAQDGKADRRRKAKKMRGHENRKKKRAARAMENELVQPRPESVQKHLLVNPPIHGGNDAADGPTTKGSYIGGRSKFEERKTYRLEDLVGPGSLGFELIEWDGWYAYVTDVPDLRLILFQYIYISTSTALLDSKKRVIGVLAGQPDNPDNWSPVIEVATGLLEDARLKCRVDPDEVLAGHRRGQFPTLRSGMSYGGGQTKPTNFRNSARHQRIIDELNQSEPFKRIAGFTSCE